MALLKYTVNLRQGRNDIVINLPSGLTIQERKLHRSCLEYKINGGYIYDTNNSVKVKLGTLPDNWAVRASIKRARNHWLKMNQMIFDDNPSLKPSWYDFKIAMLKEQHLESNNGGYTTYNVPEDIHDGNLPHNSQGITWSVFTSEDSARAPQISGQTGLTISDKDEFVMHVLGSHAGSGLGTPTEQYTMVGALESWINSRPDLEPVTTISDQELDGMQNDPLNMLFNDGDADNELVENFSNAEEGNQQQEGDNYPMYHLKNPPNQPQEVAAAFTTSVSPVSYFTGFKAMLGQVYLKITADNVGQNGAKMDIIFDVDPRGQTI